MQTSEHSKLSATKLVENAVKSRRPKTVRQLVQVVAAESALSEEDLIATVKEMAADGSLILQDPLYEVESPWDYLLTPSLSMWLWVTLIVTLLAVTTILLIPESFPVVVIRWLLGSVLVLFLPGYVLLQLLFPRPSEMDSLERFALDVGLSLALVPLIGLILYYTPWGIMLLPIATSISAFTLAFLIAAATRKYIRIRQETARH